MKIIQIKKKKTEAQSDLFDVCDVNEYVSSLKVCLEWQRGGKREKSDSFKALTS